MKLPLWVRAMVRSATGRRVTLTEACAVSAAVTVSVAVTVCGPAVFKVAARVPVPAVRVWSAGSAAAPSELVTWSVPAYPSATFPNASLTVAVTENAVPAWAVAGATSSRVAAAPEATVTAVAPVMAGETVSVAVRVCAPAVLKVTGTVPVPLASVVSAGSGATSMGRILDTAKLVLTGGAWKVTDISSAGDPC